MNFDFLDEVPAAGLSVARSYGTVDFEPIRGENFYRLKVIKLDGTFYYSNERRVDFDIDFNDVVIYPNPASEIINITLKDFAGKEGTFEIYNAFGQRVKYQEYQSFPANALQVDVSRYISGMYTVAIKVDNYRTITKKFIVTKL